jgi:hypothetical protein
MPAVTVRTLIETSRCRAPASLSVVKRKAARDDGQRRAEDAAVLDALHREARVLAQLHRAALGELQLHAARCRLCAARRRAAARCRRERDRAPAALEPCGVLHGLDDDVLRERRRGARYET